MIVLSVKICRRTYKFSRTKDFKFAKFTTINNPSIEFDYTLLIINVSFDL